MAWRTAKDICRGSDMAWLSLFYTGQISQCLVTEFRPTDLARSAYTVSPRDFTAAQCCVVKFAFEPNVANRRSSPPSDVEVSTAGTFKVSASSRISLRFFICNPVAKLEIAMAEDKAKIGLMTNDEITDVMQSNHRIKVPEGAGLETGTLSLFKALNILGYKCHHMATVVHDYDRAVMLKKIVQDDIAGKIDTRKDVDWRKVWKGFTAGLDSPFTEYYLEAAEAFPEAKVILTTRDPDKWWVSFKNMFAVSHEHPLWRPACWWFPTAYQQQILVDGVMEKWRRLAPEKGPIGPHTILAKNELFLGKPVPDEPFPRLNDGATIARAFFMVKLIGTSLWVVTLASTLGLGYLAWKQAWWQKLVGVPQTMVSQYMREL
ncbi:hypothetical protein MRB53_036869 [Persea americana]|nr:hypothetical protein MRB53_036869 [Persea americana]